MGPKYVDEKVMYFSLKTRFTLSSLKILRYLKFYGNLELITDLDETFLFEEK